MHIFFLPAIIIFIVFFMYHHIHIFFIFSPPPNPPSSSMELISLPLGFSHSRISPFLTPSSSLSFPSFGCRLRKTI